MSARDKARLLLLRWTRHIGRAVLAAGVVLGTVWAACAIYYADSRPDSQRPIRTALFLIACAVCLIAVRPRWRGVAAWAGLFVVVLVWWSTLKPSDSRNWVSENQRLAYANIDGDRVVMHNVRNYDYGPGGGLIPAWETRTYDLSKVQTVDFIVSHWESKTLAHAFLTFGFEDGRFLAISIETRREVGEEYSAVQGFFRQFELIYIVGDERDLIRLRTNIRSEDVFLFRVRATPARVRALLADYLRKINSLAARPEFYNALTHNCTTAIYGHVKSIPPYPPFDLDILLNGYSPKYAYQQGLLNNSMSYPQLHAASRINFAAIAADKSPDFSQRIREGLPR